MKKTIVVLILIFSYLQQVPALAAYGVSNIKSSIAEPKANDIFSFEFDVSRAVTVDQKYRINMSFTSSRDSFNAIADLVSGNYANGTWKANVRVPSNIYSGDFTIVFTPIGSQENNKDQLTSGSKRLSIKITGKQVPTPPQIEVTNIKTDKQNYLGGSIIKITFDTKILAGNVNEETTNPEVILWDLRFNAFERPTSNRGKPIVASGSYSTGKWTLDYPIQGLILSKSVQVHVYTPRGLDQPYLTTKGEVFQIQGLVSEIRILNIKLDKEYYVPNSKVKVTFNTLSTESTLNTSNKPYIVLTDLEFSDLSDKIETNLVSGTLNNGEWQAVFTAPDLNRFNPPITSYLLGFYNQASTIREVGPELILKKNQELRVIQPVKFNYELGNSPVDFQVSSNSNLPVNSQVFTTKICNLSENRLTFLAAGKCEIKSVSPSNQLWGDAELVTTIEITPKRVLTITCAKGKLTKKISGINPKCPAGYKIR